MVRGFRFIALTVLSILVLTIIGATFLQPAYASSIMATLSSSSVPQGTSITVSGTDTFNAGGTDTVYVYMAASPLTCAGATTIIFSFTQTVDPTGNFGPTTIATSALSPGLYCVQVGGPTVFTGLHPLTITTPAPIPEYPLGLPILAILAVIGYGVVRRRTRNEKT